MLSIVTYGRNDNYSYNLVKRTAFGFNCLAEVLTEEDEILFVDYNTPDHLPTLPESIWDTLTEKALNLVKVIRISRELHEVLKRDSPLPVLENVSRNAAIVRSNPANRWILSTNPDVLLVLSSRWRNIDDLLSSVPDSFYEMPRFDIPESVWSSLHRGDSNSNLTTLRDWIVANQAAVVETVPDWCFQKYLLFDAPGDFQLAPREYYFRMRGFDESMNKYLHSDSNLARRMWMANGCRTDHLLGNLWVLHQDHYLSGEWAKTFTGIVHNDLEENVSQQNNVIANDENWGLQDVQLPMFSLSEKVKKQRAHFFQPSPAVNGELPLNKEPDWRMQPVYRLSHYDPAILSLYLRESLQVVAPESTVAYLGQNTPSLEAIRRTWETVSPSGTPVYDLREVAQRGESVTPDVLLVDCYYQRSEYWEKRIHLVQEQMQRRLEKGRITAQEAAQGASTFADGVDYQAWQNELLPAWERLLPFVRLCPGTFVIMLGCNVYVPIYVKFKEALATRAVVTNGGTTKLERLRASHPRLIAGMSAESTTHEGRTDKKKKDHSPELLPLYVHHRIVVSRLN